MAHAISLGLSVLTPPMSTTTTPHHAPLQQKPGNMVIILASWWSSDLRPALPRRSLTLVSRLDRNYGLYVALPGSHLSRAGSPPCQPARQSGLGQYGGITPARLAGLAVSLNARQFASPTSSPQAAALVTGMS
ncbi:hypothetical protein ElyMa_001124700 [Elysia marginata]|uniref:Uncharacterized protein n=1 Tax=Elysia marginata TaxID=1093978 RepID=A0AAV4HXM3_9GAST|nr:hypothetical protein ElyMa_001124700 [Elysia marginata]